MELVDNVAKAVKKFMGDRAARLTEEREAAEAAAAEAAEAEAVAGAPAAGGDESGESAP